MDQIRKDRKQTAQELKIDEVEKSRVWSLYQSAQEKRKQIIKIEDEIVDCDSQIERLNEKIKVGCLPKISKDMRALGGYEKSEEDHRNLQVIVKYFRHFQKRVYGYEENKKWSSREYKLWSCEVCEGDLISFWICM